MPSSPNELLAAGFSVIGVIIIYPWVAERNTAGMDTISIARVTISALWLAGVLLGVVFAYAAPARGRAAAHRSPSYAQLGRRLTWWHVLLYESVPSASACLAGSGFVSFAFQNMTVSLVLIGVGVAGVLTYVLAAYRLMDLDGMALRERRARGAQVDGQDTPG